MWWRYSFCGLGIALMCVSVVLRDSARGGSAPMVRATLISPRLPPDQARHEVLPYSEVPAEWEIENVGPSDIGQLSIGLDCQCQLVTPLTAQLRRGEKTRISVRLRAPGVGRAVREIPLSVDGHSGSVANLRIELNASATVPSWKIAPSSLKVAVLESGNQPFEAVWESLEHTGRSPWLRNVRVLPTERGHARLDVSDQSASEDGTVVQRRYSLSYASTQFEDRGEDVTVELDYAYEPSTLQSIAVSHDFLTAIAAFPRRVEIATGRDTCRVYVVTRGGPSRLITPAFETTLVDVIPVNTDERARTMYDICAVRKSQDVVHTDVEFHSPGVSPARVTVVIAPSDSHEENS